MSPEVGAACREKDGEGECSWECIKTYKKCTRDTNGEHDTEVRKTWNPLRRYTCQYGQSNVRIKTYGGERERGKRE